MRPSWNDYFMEIAKMIATRSTCLRRQVGAVLVKDRRILATGYNGSPSALKHCIELGGCIREKMNIPSGQRQELCRALHAEQNAIIQAALYGIITADSTLYCTHQPCVTCAKMLINAGVKEIYFCGDYPDELAVSLMDEAGIKYSKYA